jgi:hypothetical protein
MISRPAGRRSGNVAVIAAAALVAILGAVALSLDGGQQLDKRRDMQATADATALTVASELYANWWITDPHGTDTAEAHAATLGYSVAAKNGYINGVAGCTVDINVPPENGPFNGQLHHAEVLITVNQERFFSRVFTTDVVPIGARAVARGNRSRINNGIIVLDPDDKDSFGAGGNGTVTVKSGAAVLVNSANSEAVIANGGGATNVTDYYTLNQGSIDVVGSPGYTTSGTGSTIGATINSGVEPTPDPLRFLPPPDKNSLPLISSKKLQYSSAQTITIKPGIYVGGISLSGKTNLRLDPGIYYMDGGGFNIGAQSSLWGEGVMIYNAPKSNSDTINISGTGDIHLTPPTSGPYQGVVIYQQRDAAYQPTVSITGAPASDTDGDGIVEDGKMTITGTFYVPSALLSVTGNGSQDTIGSQYISNTLAIGGNGTFTVDWNPTIIPGIREIYLVE